MSRPTVTPPLFIMGCRRSGTTLVSQLLNSHSRIATYHESFLFPIFRSELRWYSDLDREENLLRLVRHIRRVLATQVPDVPDERSIVESMPFGGFYGVFASLLHLHALRQGKVRGGDKTPEHYRHLSDIATGFPGSPLLFVMRDPRDTVHSIRRVFATSAAGAADVWMNAYRAYCLHRDSVTLVSYEALVREPELTLERICIALGEEFEPEMLNFHQVIPESFKGRLGGEKLSAPIDAGSIGKHREMSPEDIRTVESLCAAGMDEFSYERMFPPSPSPVSVSNEGPGRARFVLDRLRYYGVNRTRWLRGMARWRVVLANRWWYFSRLQFLAR